MTNGVYFLYSTGETNYPPNPTSVGEGGKTLLTIQSFGGVVVQLHHMQGARGSRVAVRF